MVDTAHERTSQRICSDEMSEESNSNSRRDSWQGSEPSCSNHSIVMVPLMPAVVSMVPVAPVLVVPADVFSQNLRSYWVKMHHDEYVCLLLFQAFKQHFQVSKTCAVVKAFNMAYQDSRRPNPVILGLTRTQWAKQELRPWWSNVKKVADFCKDDAFGKVLVDHFNDQWQHDRDEQKQKWQHDRDNFAIPMDHRQHPNFRRVQTFRSKLLAQPPTWLV